MSIMDNVKVSAIRYGELLDYAESIYDGTTSGEVVPIIRSRAKSLSLNPNALPDDPALILAHYRGKLVFYGGLLPAVLRNRTVDTKVFFGTTSEGSRRIWGTGIAPGVLREGKRLVNHFVATGNSKGIAGAYQQAGLREFQVNSGKLILWDRADRRTQWYLRANCFLSKSRYRWRSVSELPSWASEKVRSQSGIFFYRSPEVIQWMVSRPWFPESPPAAGNELRYGFHERDWRVDYRIFESRPLLSSRGSGVAVFSVVQGGAGKVVKLLDIVGDLDNGNPWWIGPAMQLSEETGSRKLFLPQRVRVPDWLEHICEPINSNYFVHSNARNFWDDFASLQTSLADGDMCFW